MRECEWVADTNASNEADILNRVQQIKRRLHLPVDYHNDCALFHHLGAIPATVARLVQGPADYGGGMVG